MPQIMRRARKCKCRRLRQVKSLRNSAEVLSAISASGRRRVEGRNVHLVLHQPNHPDYGLPRNLRLKSSKLWKETFEKGRSFAGRLMIMWLREGNDASLRLGVAAGRTIGGAVQRNRARRRLREAFRLNRHRLQGKCDVVLMARGKINKASWGELQAELIELAGRAGILKSEKPEVKIINDKTL